MAAKLEQIINDISNLSLLEVAELVQKFEEKFGVSAASMAMPGQGSGAATDAAAKPAEEKTEFKVELIEAGPDKIKTIKALRSVKKDLGITEAKKAVEEVPTLIGDAISKDEAMKMKEVLEEAGAKVKLS
ncbi:MAG: 50S ribosomal protein L7/L12 [Candidatus Babeliaceae bacterium]|jgi:large subunit ribosomal protein L7/L12